MAEIDIKNETLKCAVELFGDSFTFRPGQLDAIAAIVNNVQSSVKQTVLEAPTGSGKSIVGIIAAYVLYKLFNKKSYILTSDLSLFAQYESDMKKLKVGCFGWVKGKDNYVCWENGCNVSQSACSLKGASAASLSRGAVDGFLCKDRCEYLRDYTRAVNAPITLLTYQLYFIQRNYVEDLMFNGRNPNFPMRDLVIADECHKLCDICQAHFAPRVSIEKPDWMDTLDKYTHSWKPDYERANVVSQLLDNTSGKGLLEALERYGSFTAKYVAMNESIRAKLAKKLSLSKSDKAALAAGNIARQEHCKIEDMVDFVVERDAADYLAMSKTDAEIAVNFIFDDAMLSKYFHKKSKCELLMSATIGDFNEYAKIVGLDEKTFKPLSIASTFDFSKSPIYFSMDNKMSFAEKKVSFGNIIKQTIDICRKNCHCRGIVQTGSYPNAMALKDALPDDVKRRCLFYKGSSQKGDALQKFLDLGESADDNHILVGPTLIEGLNFPDSLCRFQICIKVPFAFLGNEYVNRKKDLVEGWYQYDALNKICQGIGRGIRHDKDWCETYILDGCINSLLGKLDSIDTLSGRFIDYASIEDASSHLTCRILK